MKKHLIILILILFEVTGCTVNREEKALPATTFMSVNKEDSLLITQNGLLFYGGKLFTGKINEYFNNGKVRSVAEYKDGEKDGRELIFYYSGQLYTERFYKNGLKDSVHTGYWPNGNKKFEYSFSDGNYDGSFKEWYEDGNISVWFNYKNGKEEGSQKGWRENGKLFINYVVKNGKAYGVIKSRLCYSVKNGQGQFKSSFGDNNNSGGNNNDGLQ